MKFESKFTFSFFFWPKIISQRNNDHGIEREYEIGECGATLIVFKLHAHFVMLRLFFQFN
jgi:hypothetical protein